MKEKCRDASGTRWLEDLWQDFRYAFRTLRQKPGFAAVALLTLALGTGATTVMFTVINGVLLKPLPYREPDRLVRVHGQTEDWNAAVFGKQNVAHFDFLDCQKQSHSLEITGWVYSGGTLSEPAPAEYVDNFEASSNLFSVLGVPLFRGRGFLPEEDRPGARSRRNPGLQSVAAPVWRKHFSYWYRRCL